MLRYVRGVLPLAKKSMLIALRTGWILGLLLAFLEPVIQFERFESGKLKIPVLIDASLSMQNFSTESSVLPFLDTLSFMEKHLKGSINFEYFFFGDSTRLREQSAHISFSDSRSVFPSTIESRERGFFRDMIIISDGHWTNPRRSSDIFPTSFIHFLTLPDAVPNSFVKTTITAPETSSCDSLFTINIDASGYAQSSGNLTLLLKKKDRIVKTETEKIDIGYFTRTVQFKTSNPRPGKELYTVEALLDSATPPFVSSFVHQTIPQHLTYSIYSAKPTLDRRYISSALISNSSFKEKSFSPDILFLFDWDSTAIRLIRELPRHAVIVFSGTLPCSSIAQYGPSVSGRQVDKRISTSNLDLRALPPPQEIINCKQFSLNGRTTIIDGAISSGAANPQTIPLLFSGRFRGIQSLFCPVKGIWRWDFWPMSSDRAESELFGFSNILLSAAKELLFENISDQLILYPSQTLYETDSARFLISFPSGVPVFEPIKLSLKIENAEISIDTVLNYYPSGLNKQPLSLQALPPGKYSISSELNISGTKALFSDNFTVNLDISELSVLAQNTQYLREFARPLDFKDSAAMHALFTVWNLGSSEKNTVTETIRISRSWLLLAAMLLLLTGELALRRKWGID